MKASRKFSFASAMRLWLSLLFVLCVFKTFAQDKQVEGIVFDKDTKDRVARTLILNTTSGKSWYNNLKGEFKIDANIGDQVVFIRQDYFADTLHIQNTQSQIIYLKRMAIPLREVTIRDSLHTPIQRLSATKKEFNKIYRSNDPFSTVPGGGAGISLDAIYNSLSREGRNARHLQDLIQQDFEQDVINYRFNKSFVANVTKLKDDELNEFMARYRPSYYRVTTDNDYEFISYIRVSLKRFLRNKKFYSQPPPLKPAQTKTASGN